MVLPRRLAGLASLAVRGSRQLSKVVNGDKVSSVTETEISSLLRDLNMPSIDGYTCIRSDCVSCVKKVHGNLYINRKTGYFVCEKCGAQGEWSGLYKLLAAAKTKGGVLTKTELSDLKAPSNGVVYHGDGVPPLEEYTSVQTLSQDTVNKMLHRFNLPAVKKLVLDQLDARIDSALSELVFPLFTAGRNIAGYRVISCRTGEEKPIRSGSMSGLLILQPERLRSRSQKTVTSAVLVPTVADVLALASYSPNIKSHIICLPNGLFSFPQDILPMLESYEKLVLWFGNSDGSWDAVRNFSKKLNEKRCYVMKPSLQVPSAHTAIADGQDALSLMSEAKPACVEGVTSFKGLRNDVLAELLNIGKVEGVKWRRFPALNHIMKGFRRGELTVLSGSTGCGKTTFMSEYSLDLAQQGIHTLWGSFEIPNHRLARIMLTQMAGMPVENHMDAFDKFADKLENLPIYFMKFHGQHASSKVLKVVEHAAYVYDIGHVIIDTVQFMMGVFEDSSTLDRFWRQDNIIAGFRTFATTNNCHVTLIIHPRKERPGDDLHLNSVFGGAKATQEADNVYMIHDQRQFNGQMFLKVLKNRYSGELGKMPMDFNKAGLSFSPRNAGLQARDKTNDTQGQYMLRQKSY